MAQNSSIEWTDATWNPVRGCSRVSEGCRNCYAEKTAARFSGPGLPYEGLVKITKAGPRWTGAVRLVPEQLAAPLRWKKPRRIFVNSMSDLFHEALPDEAIAAVFAVMALARRHTFQVLTKRPKRMRDWVTRMAAKPGMVAHAEVRGSVLALVRHWARGAQPPSILKAISALERGGGFPSWPLPNVWLGTSVEDQKTADERIPHLLATPAAVRFLSCEPLLGPINFAAVPGFNRVGLSLANWWVIAGGESGHGARPMHPNWVRSLRDQCANAGVPFLFKQWGEFAPVEGEPRKGDLWHLGLASQGIQVVTQPYYLGDIRRVGKHVAGRLLDGREWNEMPQCAEEVI